MQAVSAVDEEVGSLCQTYDARCGAPPKQPNLQALCLQLQPDPDEKLKNHRGQPLGEVGGRVLTIKLRSAHRA